MISIANILFVKNCSLSEGTILYLLIVIPGVLFSSACALFISVFFSRWHKSIFSVFYCLTFIHIPVVTYVSPQIFAFNPIVGFFPGFTYDESLHVVQRLLVYRCAVLAATGLIIAISVWIWNTRFYGKVFYQYLEIGLVAFLTPVVIVVFLFSDRLGFSSSEQFIRQKLAGNYRTAHFEIVYPAGSISRDRIEQIGKLHELYYEVLTEELCLNSANPITTFIYSTPEQKGRLIGAANTDIAKPWLRQIHINVSDVEPGLKHEMVHVLAADFGWTPLRIGSNSGLIEGVAMALEGSSTIGDKLDRTAALIFAVGMKPDVESLFSFWNFAKSPSAVSYNIVGAFCRFLIDTRGIDRFKMLYRSGDFQGIYKQNLNTLVDEWKNSLTKNIVTEPDTIKAKYFFRRTSIFGKECARVLANINSDVKDLLNHRDYEKALALADYSLSLSKTPEAINRKVGALFELRRFQDVVSYMESELQDSSISSFLLPLRLRFGDAYWALDSLEEAKEQYEFLAATHLNEWYDEICALRLESLKDKYHQSELRQFFVFYMEDTTRIARLEQLSHPIARFLLAREYAGKERFRESTIVLHSMNGSIFPRLEYFRLRHLGLGYYSLREFEKAKEIFIKALSFVPSSSSELKVKEWIKRCEFMQP